MNTPSLMIRVLPGLLLCAFATLAGSAQANTASAKQQYAEESKRIAARYTEDKKVCADAADSASRMQCLRDAKTEHDKAVKLAKDNLKNAGGSHADAHAICHDCGKVTAVQIKEVAGEGGALGLIAGGVAGALLGNQVGKGHGREAATIAGAAGGAWAGNKIEQKANTTKVWEVTVQHDNGSSATFSFKQDPGFAVGDVVEHSGESIVKRSAQHH
jgi:outer membrane lipoprotein SlyB